MKRTLAGCVVVSLIALVALAVLADDLPRPTKSEYFKTEGGGFMNSENAVYYAIFLKPRKYVNGKDKWYALVEYENPENSKEPFVQSLDFPASKEAFTLKSDKFYSIKNHKTYKVTLKAYKDADHKILITAHDAYVGFDLPDEMAKSMGLKLL